MFHRQGVVYVACLAIFVVTAQTLIPSFPKGCPYIATSCTRVELLPTKRNDSCHQDIATGFSQDVAAADEQQVHLGEGYKSFCNQHVPSSSPL